MWHFPVFLETASPIPVGRGQDKMSGFCQNIFFMTHELYFIQIIFFCSSPLRLNENFSYHNDVAFSFFLPYMEIRGSDKNFSMSKGAMCSVWICNRHDYIFVSMDKMRVNSFFKKTASEILNNFSRPLFEWDWFKNESTLKRRTNKKKKILIIV